MRRHRACPPSVSHTRSGPAALVLVSRAWHGALRGDEGPAVSQSGGEGHGLAPARGVGPPRAAFIVVSPTGKGGHGSPVARQGQVWHLAESGCQQRGDEDVGELSLRASRDCGCF